MHRTVQVALGGAAFSLGLVVGLPSAALATTPLDCTNAEIAAVYPEQCIPRPGEFAGGNEAPGQGGGGAGAGTGGTVTSARGAAGALPFTGDEILVLTLAGGAALAAGTALTVAGRRRGATTA